MKPYIKGHKGFINVKQDLYIYVDGKYVS